jgi:hypothetical protein
MPDSKTLVVLAMPEGFEVHINFSERGVTDRAALANVNTQPNVNCGCSGDCVC